MPKIQLGTYLDSLCSSSNQSVLLVLGSVLFGFIFFFIKPTSRRNRPPGPFSLPLIGNIHQLGRKPWETCLKWKKKYGPIMTVKFATMETIVLTDAKLIKEAYALQSLAGRPRIKIFQEPGRGRGVGQGDGPFAVEQRQFAIKQLKTLVHQSQLIEEKIKEEVNILLEEINKKCGDGAGARAAIQMDRRFDVPSLNVVWNLFMGYRFEHHDPKIKRIICVLGEAAKFDGILEMLSFFAPILIDLFPNATGNTKRVKAFNGIYDMFEDEFNNPPPSYIPGQPTNYKEAFKDQVTLNKDNPASSFYPPRNEFPIVLGDILAGSSETVGATLSWFLIYMLLNPEIQEKVYAEVQSVTGGSPPSLSDRPKTPYAEAVVHELLRIMPAIPLGIFHRAMEDTKIFGYLIKKNMLIVSNLWGVNNDPEIWDQPQKFQPERFLQLEKEFSSSSQNSNSTAEQKLNYSIKQDKVKQILTFSSGKRSCPGESIARDTIYMYVTTLIQNFEMTFDPAKKPKMEDATTGFVYTPKPFEIIFKKRV